MGLFYMNTLYNNNNNLRIRKDVPVFINNHAIKMYEKWVVGFTAPASLPPEKEPPWTHSRGGYVGPRAGLNTVKYR
jgi:hypothetical protein